MRFKLTILLLAANVAMLLSIWILERAPAPQAAASENFVDLTHLEITGKSLDKPRVLKLENNRWRIVSPIEWAANYYAVSRIRNQLEILANETSFPVSEIEKHGQTIADYGLDDPVLTFRYGDGKNMRELKIGRNAPVGDRVYMLDSENERIIVADKTLAETLSSEVDLLRGQAVFDIPRFEVASFSIRLSQGDGKTPLKSNLRRIGLVRDGDSWNFETPIVAAADAEEVKAFLNGLCSVSARSFAPPDARNTGLELTSMPTAIKLEGTNRMQTLLLGNVTPGGTLQYARLEDNPTVFLVESEMFRNLGRLQTSLRDKAFLKFDEVNCVEIDISTPSSSVKLKKLDSGVWDAIGKNSAGAMETVTADYAIVNSIISRMKQIRAREFVTDAPGEESAKFGFDPPACRIMLRQANGSSQTLIVGAEFAGPDGRLRYAKMAGDAPVYGILPSVMQNLPSDVLSCKSRMFNVLPEKAQVLRVALSDVATGKTFFELSAPGGDWARALQPLPEKRRIAAFRVVESVRKFVVARYLEEAFSEKGASAGGREFPWKYRLSADIEMPGTGGDKSETRSWVFSDRVSGSLQYGGSAAAGVVFELPQSLVDSISELTIEADPPIILKTPPPQPVLPPEAAAGAK